MIGTNAPSTKTKIEIHKTSKSRIHEVNWENLEFGKIFSDHMLVMDYKDGKWQNPAIVPYGPIPMSPSISALHYGQAIFEGMKAYKMADGGVSVFRPERNAVRFSKSAARMCMPTIPVELFLDCLTRLISLDKEWVPSGTGQSLYIRPHMFATDEYVGVKPSETYKFVIFSCPVGKYYTKELRVKIETTYTRASRGGTGAAKAAGNYGAALFPTQVARNAGFDQMIWTDGLTHEYLEESGTMNIIFRTGNVLLTPATSDSILDGVTRDTIIQLARDWGFLVEERKISVREIVELMKEGRLHAAFGVGTAATITPIRIINYEGVDYDLGAYEEGIFAPRVNAHLSDLKRGLLPDVHNWNYRID